MRNNKQILLKFMLVNKVGLLFMLPLHKLAECTVVGHQTPNKAEFGTK